MPGAQRLLDLLGKLFFATAAASLFLLAVSLVGLALYKLFNAYLTPDTLLLEALASIGLVTIAVAVFDVGKFLVEEELVRSGQRRSINEARASMTKFFTIIIIALALEAIVLVFEAKLERPELVIYPTALMGVVVLALVGLGLFRRLTEEREGIQVDDVGTRLEEAARRARR